MEEEDNNLCIMEGTQYKDKDSREIYWKCRLRVMDKRIDDESQNYGSGSSYQNELKKLRKSIKDRRDKEKELNISETSNVKDEKEDDYCLMLKSSTNDAVDANDYYKCKEEADKTKQKNEDYNDQDNQHVLKKFQSIEETKQPQTTITINEECTKYIIDSGRLERCQKAMTQMKECKDDKDNKIKQRQIDDKVYCTKSSVEKFPDSLASFTNNTDTTNFGPKVDKIKIIDLRQKEYDQCIIERNKKLKEYKTFLENECKKENIKLIE